MSTEQSTNPGELEQTREQLRGLVAEIAAMADQGFSPQEYYEQFLTRVVEALAAVGGAVWRVAGPGKLELAYHVNLKASSLEVEGEHQQRHARLLGAVIESGDPALVPPHSGAGDENEGANPTELLLVLAPIRGEGQVEAVVEVFQRPTPNPATRRGYLRFLAQMCDLAGQWAKARALQEYGDRQSLWRQIDAFAQSAHDSLDIDSTAFTIANEAQGIVGCDRASVAIRRGTRCKIAAVSGQDTVENRSNAVRLLSELATRVVKVGDPLWYSGSMNDLPPQLEQTLDEYLDEAHSKTVAVIPLRRPRREAQGESVADDEALADRSNEEPLGALVFEMFREQRPQPELESRVEMVVGHSARALGNALQHNDLFLQPVWTALGKTRWLVSARNLPKTIVALIALLAIVVSLIVVPADFELTGEGELQPTRRRDVFADIDGVVSEVHVEHGSPIKQGEPLFTLRNTDLEVRLADVLGQQRAVAEQLAAIKRSRHDAKLSQEERNRLAGQASELEQRAEGLQNQYDLLLLKRDRLKVVSPIDGRVVTWNVRRQLLNRPVTAGQVLVTVADASGPWELEVFMPENRMGHIDAARNELGEALSVTYVVATDATEHFEGTVRDVHAAAELHEQHGQAVRILVDVDEQDLAAPHPGASVTAKVYCGRRALGYVWLHDIWEFMQSRVFFYF
jgi:multidrug efflux pump subunit AcrA (membrane-fusion protein)